MYDNGVLVLFRISSVQSQDYTPSKEELEERQALLKSIDEPGLISRAFSQASYSLAPLFPEIWVKRNADIAAAYVMNYAGASINIRHELKDLTFAKDNKVFKPYDEIIGVHHVIPKSAQTKDSIDGVIEYAKKEREGWANGKKSGAVYDGSEQHMKDLGEFYAQALERDEDNREIFLGKMRRQKPLPSMHLLIFKPPILFTALRLRLRSRPCARLP